MRKIEFHPVAEIFPLMDDASFRQLVDDIKSNGLREEIWTHDEKFIDGRNRYRACIKAEVEPRFREHCGNDLIKFVVSLNLHRRHLDESQRAMVAARISNLKTGNPHFHDKNAIVANATIETPISQTQAAAVLNVSRDSVVRARKILEKGVPELVRAVDFGKVSVAAAADISSIDRDEQRLAVAAGNAGVMEKARVVRQARVKVAPVAAPTYTRKLTGLKKAPEAIRGAIGTLVGLACGLDSFSPQEAAPSKKEMEQWEKDLASVVSAINKFRRQLKECVHV